MNGAAFRPEPGQAPTFWAALTAPAPTQRTLGANAPSQAARGAGVAKVWLDRTVRTALDQSVPQIGAPTVWEQGYDGSGVKVGVLDTGIDPNHPDLAGRLAASANFTTEDSIVDMHGHGTHVASIIAGSGAASSGQRKGTAPGASLLVGKVTAAPGRRSTWRASATGNCARPCSIRRQ